MNRIILIGNGFDLAHGLKTSYASFIDWYWKKWGERLLHGRSRNEEDGLVSFRLNNKINAHSWSFVWGNVFLRQNPMLPWDTEWILDFSKTNRDLCDYVVTSALFEELCKQLEEKNWVDIENVYFKHLSNGFEESQKVNAELSVLRTGLIEYLTEIKNSVPEIGVKDDLRKKMLVPIDKRDIAIGSLSKWREMLKQRADYRREVWHELIPLFFDSDKSWIEVSKVDNFFCDHADEINENGIESFDDGKIPISLLLPDRILMLNFNYTNVADSYLPNVERFGVNHIHGELSNPESVIFGYGDEIDENYKKLSNKNDNEYLKNIKSIKYLESPNYRNLLDFIESDTYQIFIMGHSCGNSDRTLLNTLFEHKNCVSIKPFYHVRKDGTDNYMELVQNISRNFTDMKLMRDRVVNKTFCELYSDEREAQLP
jgi:hypothetical protein